MKVRQKPLPNVITLNGSRALLRVESHTAHAPHPAHTTHAAHSTSKEGLKKVKWIRLKNDMIKVRAIHAQCPVKRGLMKALAEKFETYLLN